MKVTIEDLEALKALNDELEENHVEAEKQLQIEIGESFVLLIVDKALHDRHPDGTTTEGTVQNT